MKTTIVRYKVKAGRTDENVQYISKVFEQLKQELPSGFRYASFALEDGVSFLHMAILDDDTLENPLPQMKAFQDFTSHIHDRCQEPPMAMSADMVGAYRLMEDLKGL